jgi:CBS domain-containing protein
MRCEEVMSKKVECLSPQDSVQAAAKRMRDSNVGFIPICDASHKVIGTVTDRDLAIKIIAEGHAADTNIQQVMSREVISCRADEDLKVAEDLMGKHQKSRVVCLDSYGKLAGVISLADLSQHEDAAKVSQTLRQVKAHHARAA